MEVHTVRGKENSFSFQERQAHICRSESGKQSAGVRSILSERKAPILKWEVAKSLNVVCIVMSKKGIEKMANVRNRSRTMAIEVCFSFNFAVVFDFNLFLVLPSKAKAIGYVLMNRQNTTIISTWFFFSFVMQISYN